MSNSADVGAVLSQLSETQLQALVKLAKQQGDRKRNPYFDRLDRARAELNGMDTYITSIPDTDESDAPGVVFMATSEIAAHHIAMRTHRLSSKEEVTAYQEDFNRRTEASQSRQRTKSALDNAAHELALMEPVAARRPTSKKGD